MEKADLLFRVGEWTVEPKRGLARRRDKKVHLEPKAAELLSYLALRSGEVVSRAELLDAVWPDVTVGDEVITNAIAKLRRALGDDPKSPELIETIPKRGYRIAASVSETPAATVSIPLSPWLWIVALVVVLVTVGAVMLPMRPWAPKSDTASIEREAFPLPERPSIAVLPFNNLSGDSEQEYFVDGMTEDLITDLSRVSGLFVIARNSSFAYKGRSVDVKMVGRELGVHFIVEGSARKVGAKVRINVQLIDAGTGGHLWAERYDGDVADLFTFQDKITAMIVAALSVKLTGIEKDHAAFQETREPGAYEAFLKGWAAYRRETPEDFARAIAHFEAAVEKDPAYGRAFAALAAIYWESYRKRWYRRLGISPSSLAWQRANEYLEKSMVAPTPLAHKIASAMLTMNRRFGEAITEAERAISIDPNDPLGYVALADVLVFTGSSAEAERLVRKAMRLDPQDPAPYLLALGKAQLGMGAVSDAILSLERATHRSPDNRLAWMALISAYGSLGQVEKAKAALETLGNLQRRDKLVSITVAKAREHWPFETAGDGEKFLDGLRKAGVPEW